jgi:hypothetical protein
VDRSIPYFLRRTAEIKVWWQLLLGEETIIYLLKIDVLPAEQPSVNGPRAGAVMADCGGKHSLHR